MSNRHVTAAWNAAVPSTQKLVLVYVCDRANDDGDCYFLIKTAQEQCGLSDRAVQKALASLEEGGYLARDTRPGRSTVYKVADPVAWPPPNDVHPRTTFTPERGSPPNVIHPRTTFTPEPGSPTPEPRSPTPEPRSPITISKPSPNPVGDGAGEQASAGDPQVAPNVAAAMAMIQAGIPRHEVNPQHAELVELAATRPLREFELAAGQAAAGGQGFAYALGIVKRRARDAARSPPAGSTAAPSKKLTSAAGSFKDKTYGRTSIEQLPPELRAAAERALAGADAD